MEVLPTLEELYIGTFSFICAGSLSYFLIEFREYEEHSLPKLDVDTSYPPPTRLLPGMFDTNDFNAYFPAGPPDEYYIVHRMKRTKIFFVILRKRVTTSLSRWYVCIMKFRPWRLFDIFPKFVEGDGSVPNRRLPGVFDLEAVEEVSSPELLETEDS